MESKQPKTMKTKKPGGQVTLTEMLKVLDKDVAVGIEKKLKKLSKKAAVKAPLNKSKADQLERKAAYTQVSKEVTKWEPIVERNRRAKQLNFPLDQQPDFLPTSADAVSELKPQNQLEIEVQRVVNSSDSALRDKSELSKSEEKYLKSISVEEAQERHQELQRMRVLLSSYASKMRRQKAIKSKNYRRLLKKERIRNHVKRVESNQDNLMDEIERLQKLRAQERASLKHKNTGKWAKHAKFRAKYDDEARKAMLEQIGIAEQLLERPAVSDSEEESGSDDEESYESEESSDEQDDMDTQKSTTDGKEPPSAPISDRMIISKEIINERSTRKRKSSGGDDHDSEAEDDVDEDDDDDDDDDNQRRLMSEAFADDDVVADFKRAKDAIADEEQPKDVDLYLPGWGGWAGPGIRVNKRLRNKLRIKAKKLPRRDDNLGNVIISEQADEKMREKMIKKLPRGIRNEKQLEKIISKPTSATFVSQSAHREAIRPRVQTKMGARIEPISKAVLQGGNKAKWA